MSEDINKMLVDILLDNGPIKELVDLAACYVGVPLALQDFMHQSIAVSEKYPADDLDDRVQRRKKAEEDEYLKDIEWIRQAICDGVPHKRSWPNIRRSRMYCGCLNGKKLMAFLRIVDGEKTIDEVDEGKVAYVARILGSSLALKGYPPMVDNERWPSFLWNLLENNSPEFHNYFIVQPFFENVKRFRAYWFAEDALFGIIERKLGKRCWYSIPSRDGYVALADDAEVSTEVLASAFGEASSTVGASDSFEDIRTFRVHAEQAMTAFTFATKLRYPKVGIARYSDYKTLALIRESLLSGRNTHDILPETYFDMKSSDEGRGTEYLATAYSYLSNGRNAEKAAEDLAIHKNTVLYRVSKINDLFGLDLNDGRAGALFLVALLIEAVMG